MYSPISNSFASNFLTFATVDFSAHTLLGASWNILLPYTIFGIGLMFYSQGRLLIGQQKLKSHKK